MGLATRTILVIGTRKQYLIAGALVGAGIAYTLFVAGMVHWWQRFWRKAPRPERRRAQRIALAVPVFVYGRLRNQPFWESTETLDVSATGGLIPLTVKLVAPRQTLAISNLRTNETVLCRVARVESKIWNIIVGFEFLRSSPKFFQHS